MKENVKALFGSREKKKKKGSEKCYAGQAILKDMLKHAKDIHFSTIRNKPITFCLFFSREPNRK
jgi:hypothetical protein